MDVQAMMHVPMDYASKGISAIQGFSATAIEELLKHTGNINASIPFVPAAACYVVILSLFCASLRGFPNRLSYPFMRRLVEVIWRLSFPCIAFTCFYVPTVKLFCIVFSSVQNQEQRLQLILALTALLSAMICIWAFSRHTINGLMSRSRWFAKWSPLPLKCPRRPTIGDVKRVAIGSPKKAIILVKLLIKNFIIFPLKALWQTSRGRKIAN